MYLNIQTHANVKLLYLNMFYIVDTFVSASLYSNTTPTTNVKFLPPLSLDSYPPQAYFLSTK